MFNDKVKLILNIFNILSQHEKEYVKNYINRDTENNKPTYNEVDMKYIFELSWF